MNPPIRITNAEWEVMTVVWRRAPVAASAIVEELYGSKRWTLTTVRTLLRRLVNKRALTHHLEGKRYIYLPLVSLEACVQQEIDSFGARVLSRAPLTTIRHLFKRADLSKEDIQELRRILREKERKLELHSLGATDGSSAFPKARGAPRWSP